MGDVFEVRVTPETPGRPAILNPFESPNDYHRLHESVVASPSVFKTSRCSSATPAKFKWSIDEMASLLPVEIDPEDIERQAMYLSQTRMDKEIEEKRQHAIEQFFTKKEIVPSPWGVPVSKQSTQIHTETCAIYPGAAEENCLKGRSNAACQTLLSLPIDFDLQKILGDYYKVDDVLEQAQESLSSSSLRRKLFLDGFGSGSDSSTPSSPERNIHEEVDGRSVALETATVSPLQCGVAALTPSSGQFSSSPIQGRCRTYSLGSMTSPLFPDNSSPSFKSPLLSPIIAQHVKTPLSGERKKLNFMTPDGMALGSCNTDVSRCSTSPFVEGCSPIKSCSPILHRARRWPPSRYRASPLQLLPEEKENICPDDSLFVAKPSACPVPAVTLTGGCKTPLQDVAELLGRGVAVASLACVQENGDSNTVNMEEPAESCKDYSAWTGRAADSTHIHLTSSRTGSMSSVENSHMFASLLADGSNMPSDSSMQVDSGYNTHSVTTNGTMDGVNYDGQTKDSVDVHVSEEAMLCMKNQHIKSKYWVKQCGGCFPQKEPNSCTPQVAAEYSEQPTNDQQGHDVY